VQHQHSEYDETVCSISITVCLTLLLFALFVIGVLQSLQLFCLLTFKFASPFNDRAVRDPVHEDSCRPCPARCCSEMSSRWVHEALCLPCLLLSLTFSLFLCFYSIAVRCLVCGAVEFKISLAPGAATDAGDTYTHTRTVLLRCIRLPILQSNPYFELHINCFYLLPTTTYEE
jgi:hypothetical protein